MERYSFMHSEKSSLVLIVIVCCGKNGFITSKDLFESRLVVLVSTQSDISTSVSESLLHMVHLQMTSKTATIQ